MSRPKRKSISTRQRFEVFKRDGFICQYCGAYPPVAVLHVDHIHPVKDGGTNVQDNLITSCSSCNLGKSSVSLSSVPQSLKDKAARVAEQERQIAGYNEILELRRARLEDDAWRVAAILEYEGEVDNYSRQGMASIKRFLGRLPTAQVVDLAEYSSSKEDTSTDGGFRYFCKCCWNAISSNEGQRKEPA